MLKQKKFYKDGETVKVKETGRLVKVLSLDIPNYTVTVGWNELGKASIAVLKLWEITKVSNNLPKTQTKKQTILWAKVNPEARIPSKRKEDGCYDIYACFDEPSMTILPHETKLIPTGIASSLPPNLRFNCKRERGSTGRWSMSLLSGQIDSGYRGEWFLMINNTSNKPIMISKGVTETMVATVSNDEAYLGVTVIYPYSKAIAQAALEEVPDVIDKEIPYEELKKIPSTRGVGKLGSSGK